MATSSSIPIPDNLLSHPSISNHPHVLEMHNKHGGVPADADKESLQHVMEFTNEVAHHGVDPNTMRRADPSPRRAARVFRAEVLGHRDPSVSPERRRSISQTRANAAANAETTAADAEGNESAPPPGRYRSQSRPPPSTIKEEPEAHAESERQRMHGAGTPGRRDGPLPAGVGPDPSRALENRLDTVIQQQHEFQDRLLHLFSTLEAEMRRNMEEMNTRHKQQDQRFIQLEARNTNKVNHYLGIDLVPVTNGKEDIPKDLPALTSVEVIQNLPSGDVRSWLKYYTGDVPAQQDEVAKTEGDNVTQDLRRALRACTGVEPVFMT